MFQLLSYRNRPQSFVSRQIAPVTILALLSTASDYAGSIFSTLIVGGRFGETGLIVVGVMTPIMGIVLFVCDMFCGGAVYLRNVCISEGQREKGERITSCTFIITTLIGLAIAAFLYLFGGRYLAAYDLSADVYEIAVRYIRALAFHPLFTIWTYYTYEFCFRRGMKWATSLSIFFASGGVAILGLVFTKSCGIVGMAYAMLVGMILCSVIGGAAMLLHREEYHFCPQFRMSDMKELFAYGFSYSQETFYYPIYSAVICLFIGRNLGEGCIAVFTVITCVTELCSIFYGVSYASENLLSIYFGEENSDGIRKTLAVSLKLQGIIAIIATVLVLIFSVPIAEFMGMEEAYRADTIFALRAYACGFLPLALLCFNGDYYCCIEKFGACIILYFSKLIIVGIGLTLLLGTLFGSNGIYIAMALESPIALLMSYFVIRKRYHSNNPYLVAKDDSIVSFDYDITEKEVMRTRDEVEKMLIARGVSHESIMKILLTFEESNLLTLERNKKNVYAECTLFFRDSTVDMIIRDSGTVFDASDADSRVTSLRSYLVANMSRRYHNVSHINASGTNRLTFSFPR